MEVVGATTIGLWGATRIGLWRRNEEREYREYRENRENRVRGGEQKAESRKTQRVNNKKRHNIVDRHLDNTTTRSLVSTKDSNGRSRFEQTEQ